MAIHINAASRRATPLFRVFYLSTASHREWTTWRLHAVNNLQMARLASSQGSPLFDPLLSGLHSVLNDSGVPNFILRCRAGSDASEIPLGAGLARNHFTQSARKSSKSAGHLQVYVVSNVMHVRELSQRQVCRALNHFVEIWVNRA